MARKREPNADESKKVLELKKHVAVIHSNNKLTLLQRKIANALLFNAYNELLNKDEHEIHIATLCRLIGYDSHDHKTIKKSLVNLLSTVLEWNLVDGDKVGGEGVWNASSIIADASIDGALCTYSYSNKMRKLLHRPNVYGRLDMLVQAKFQSSYGLALYENCNRFQDIGKSPWFELHKFRKLMGVDDNKYLIFRDFKTRVLDKAVEEVNKYSRIVVTPQVRKVNRRVVAIQFTIKRMDHDAPVLLPIHPGHSQLSEILKHRFGFSKKQINQVLASYENDYIREKVQLIEQSVSYKEGKIVNLAKYLLSALKDDYQSTLSNAPTAKRATKSKGTIEGITGPSNVVDIFDFDKLKHLEQEKMQKYRYYQDHCLIALFNKQPETDKERVTKEFEKYMHTAARGVYIDIFLRDGLANPLIQDQMCLFLRQTKQELLAQVLSYEDWMIKKM